MVRTRPTLPKSVMDKSAFGASGSAEKPSNTPAHEHGKEERRHGSHGKLHIILFLN